MTCNGKNMVESEDGMDRNEGAQDGIEIFEDYVRYFREVHI